VAYETPKIVDLGDLVELTAAFEDGNFTDADFPTNTPKDLITFTQ
jgi:hypothetical protein